MRTNEVAGSKRAGVRAGSLVAVVALALVLVLGATPARAQCGMMGGHDHGKSAEGHDHGAAAKKPSRNQKKLEQSAQRLLAEDEGRMVLLQAALADGAFMRMLIAALADVPEWRALAAERLAAAPAIRSGDVAEEETAYTCPMHPDVAAKAPGSCPKCGMKLEPTESKGR